MVNLIATSLLVVFAASQETGQASQASTPPAAVAPAEEKKQQPPDIQPEIKLSGPRVGVTFLSDGVVRKLHEDLDGDFDNVGSVVSQFGWQWEKRFLTNQSGLTAVTEWAFLMGGLEQGVFIPSLSWLVGLRTAKGIEFAVGPNFTPAGPALAVAGGVTLRAGNLNFPLNLAVVPSHAGVRVSFLAGFNARKR
jgi:hypothetical protein